MKEDNLQTDAQEEFSFIDLFAILFKYKKMIVGITLFAMVTVLVYSIITMKLPSDKSPNPNVYTSTAYILISESTSSSTMNNILSSSGLGTLAGLVGVSSSTSSNVGLASFLLRSAELLDKIIEEFNLTVRYKISQSPIINTRSELLKRISSNIDKETGVFSISFTDTDPVFARDVVNYAVKLLDNRFVDLNLDSAMLTKKNLEENIDNTYNELVNLQSKIEDLEHSVSYVKNTSSVPSIVKETAMLKLELDAQKEMYKQLKAQDTLMKVDLASTKPVFQVLQFGEIPDKKSGPSRGLICIVVSFAAFLGSLLLVFFIHGIKKIKMNPETIAKFKLKK